MVIRNVINSSLMLPINITANTIHAILVLKRLGGRRMFQYGPHVMGEIQAADQADLFSRCLHLKLKVIRMSGWRCMHIEYGALVKSSYCAFLYMHFMLSAN